MKTKTPTTQMKVTELTSAAEKLLASGQRDAAVNLYRDWIRLNPRSPSLYLVRYNLGCLLNNENKIAESLLEFEACINSAPHFLQSYLAIGTISLASGDKERAIRAWLSYANSKANSAPDPATMNLVLRNLGILLEETGRWQEAEEILQRSLRSNPNQGEVIYHWVRLRQRLCAWPVYLELPGLDKRQLIEQTSAIAMLSVSDDPLLQRQSAQANANRLQLGTPARLSPVLGYKHERIRIAYLSSNFNLHAVSMLTAELYELHDRSRFEVFGFSWSPEDGSPMLQRIKAAMDHWKPIHELSDEDAAKAIRAAEIDILIDLQGLTGNSRPRILGFRPAPIQISYLGQPGTACIPGVDYLLADRYVIPPEYAPSYEETPLYLPECYQVNDRKRPSGRPASRSNNALPEDAFVFCAFGNTNKFTPELFSVWMNILGRVHNGVLWLLADTPWAEANLLKQIGNHGIPANRIIFSRREDYETYLGRFPLADLFLDTFPFNGGTTTSDALWTGLPVVTCSGRCFASRMSGSLLHAIGAPELITDSLTAYEDLAVSLAQNPDRLSALRKKIAQNKETHSLFDTPRFVKGLENLLLETVRAAPVANKLPIPGHTEEQLANDPGKNRAISRLVIYTVLIGNKEPLGNPLSLLPATGKSDLDIDFICITDNRTLKSDVWTFKFIDQIHLPPEKLSRRPKMLPHLYFEGYSHSLYIDNIVSLKRLPTLADLETANPYLFRVFQHSSRKNLLDEVDVIALLGYENVGTICRQIDFYKATAPIETITPISTCTVILRSHHHPKLIELGTVWWEQFLNFSKRDQLSFDYSVKLTNCTLEFFSGTKESNTFIECASNLSENRAKANFDPVRYAWINRNDAGARSNPSAHFLSNSNKSDRRYNRRSDLFSYICYRSGSSLGDHVAPRRGISDGLEDILSKWRNRPGNLLIMPCIGSRDRFVFQKEEFTPATNAFSMMLNQHKASFLEISADVLRNVAHPFTDIQNTFDVVVFLGLEPACLPLFFKKIRRMIKPEGGLIIVISSGECEPQKIAKVQQEIGNTFSTPCRTMVSHSHHDESEEAVLNSLMYFEWQKSQGS